MQKIKPTMEHNLGLLTVTQAAMKLGVSQNTIRKWQQQGKLPFVKLFSTVRFDPEDLNKLIGSMKVRMETVKQ